MTGAEYIVESLIQQGVTDVFGIPGWVVLDLLYTIDSREEISAHLSCHEQAAAFAAMGYAQASGKLGVAYATRGPGITNLVTGIADAYFENVPTLFLTAHEMPFSPSNESFVFEQEFNTVAHLEPITKFAARIETAVEFKKTVDKAINEALYDEKGPVFLDILFDLLKTEIAK